MNGPASAADRQRITVAAFLTGALTIALSGVMVRRAFDFGSSAEGILVIRVTVPALLFAVMLALGALQSRQWPRCERRYLAMAGLFGIGLFAVNLLEVKALERTPVAVVILIIALVPLWITLGSWFLWRTPVGRMGFLALTMAVGGTALVVGLPSADLDANGIAFSFAASIVAAAIYLLLERKLYQPPTLIVVAVGTAVAAVLAIAVKPDGVAEELANDYERALLVVGAGTGAAIALLCILIGLRHSSAFVAGIAVTIEPVFAGVLAWWILGETLTAFQLVGAVVVLAALGVAIAHSSPRGVKGVEARLPG